MRDSKRYLLTFAGLVGTAVALDLGVRVLLRWAEFISPKEDRDGD